MTDDNPAYARAHIAEFYDHIYEEADRKDVDFYVDLATESGGSVLELGCGTGRVLIPTARAGVAVTGIDLSEHMLEICRSKLAQEADDVPARARTELGDIRDFELGTTFALVTVPFRPFQHLITVEEQLACLSAVHRHLAPGGRLALDVFNPNLSRLLEDSGREIEESGPQGMPDGRTVARKYRLDSIDLDGQIQHMELIYDITHPDGREERTVHAFPFRYFFRYEVEHLLARAGFEIEALYGDFDRSPVGSKSAGELIFVPRKS